MRVLVVEDELRMAALIRQGLEEEAYAVDVLHDGTEALDWLRAYPYDLVVLDVMLPGMDGMQICLEYRRLGGSARVLMLTARDTMKDRVTGLDSGADDYLVKPFGMPELLARLRALTRRDAPQKSNDIQVADLTLNIATKQATRGGVTIDLTATEFALLEYLMRNAGQILSREQVISHIWDADFDSDSKLIEVYIHHLRRKIDDGYADKRIQTVRGLGYRISRDDE